MKSRLFSGRAWIAIVALAAVLTPVLVRAWGTASSPAEMTAAELKLLHDLMGNSGIDNSAAFWADFEARRGPHVIHQFIAHQAVLVLKKDPAFREGDFPPIEEINRWDGQFRVPEGTNGLPAGPTEKLAARRPGEEGNDQLNSIGFGAESPGPDAETTRAGSWNPFYNGRAHYWNPWLQCGGAPDEAGCWYVELVDALMDGTTPMRDKARMACYMAHYVGDVASPKHADAFEIPERFFGRIKTIANTFSRGDQTNAASWVASAPVASLRRLFRQITAASPGGGSSDAYWNRVEEHITEYPLLNAGEGTFVSVVPKSINSACAAFLDGVAHRPILAGVPKPMNVFFNYFDPFYFNGEIVHPSSGIKFGLATPGSAHLHYESNMAQMAYARANLTNPVISTVPSSIECGFMTSPSFGSTENEGKARREAMVKAMAGLVKHCSSESHGDIGSAVDFNEDRITEPMHAGIRHVAAAFRACITALRVDARLIDSGMGVNTGQKRAVRCKFTNVASKSARLQKATLSWSGSAALKVSPSPEVALGGRELAKDQVITQTWEVEAPEGSPLPEFRVDLFGFYAEIPDRGWERAKVNPGGLSVVFGGGAAESKVTGTGPLDLVVVFDTTGSMQPSIDSVKKQTVKVIESLSKKCPDMRVGLVEFRDFQDKAAAPLNAWGFAAPSEQISRIGAFKAIGGGDTPEDQYEAIMRAIKMKWRNSDSAGNQVTKLIVVITDAEAKKPDIFGNTCEKVTKAAFDLDPAHIYPIVVGSSSTALADAEQLAKLSDGKVLKAESGEAVADKLLEAVETGIEEHAAPAAPAPPSSGWPPVLFLACGSVLSLFGVGLLLGGLIGGTAVRPCSQCGGSMPMGKKFCSTCGSSMQDRAG